MCGRYTQHHDAGALQTRFAVANDALTVQDEESSLAPRYNIAPRQQVAVVFAGDESAARTLDTFEWGLIPHWAKDPTIGAKMINARAETVYEKPSFKTSLIRRRCIIPADGFYEWDKISGSRQPFHFRRKDGELFGFAGLWDEWRGPDKDFPPVRTCTIITTQANETVGRIHERMPVILRFGEAETLWLDPAVHNADALVPLLVPYPDDEMEAFSVSRRVNTPATDDPDLIAAAMQNIA